MVTNRDGYLNALEFTRYIIYMIFAIYKSCIHNYLIFM